MLSELSSSDVNEVIAQLLQSSHDALLPESESPPPEARHPIHISLLESESLPPSETLLSNDAPRQSVEHPGETRLSNETATKSIESLDPSEPPNDINIQTYNPQVAYAKNASLIPETATVPGWENFRLDRTDGQRPTLAGQLKYSEAQIKSIGVLNADLEVGRGRIPPKVLGPIAKVIYFRNLDISALDLSRLLSNVSSPARRENIKKSLKNTTLDLQRKIWCNDWFLEWVRNHVPSAARGTYGALPTPKASSGSGSRKSPSTSSAGRSSR